MLWNETSQQRAMQQQLRNNARPGDINIAPRSGENYVDYEDAIGAHYERKRQRLLKSSAKMEEKAILQAVRFCLQNDKQLKRVHKLLKRTEVSTHTGILEEMLKGFRNTKDADVRGLGGSFENSFFAITFDAPGSLPDSLSHLEASKSIYPDKKMAGLPDISEHGITLLSSLYHNLLSAESAPSSQNEGGMLRSSNHKASSSSLPLLSRDVSSCSLKSEQPRKGFRRRSTISRSVDSIRRLREELSMVEPTIEKRETTAIRTQAHEVLRMRNAVAALDVATVEGSSAGTKFTELQGPKKQKQGAVAERNSNKTLLELLESASDLTIDIGDANRAD